MDARLRLIKMPKLRTKLLEYYEKIGEKLKTLPASTKFHHNWNGGLYDHVLEVIDFGILLYDSFSRNSMICDFTKDDVIFVCFAHDLDKINKYVKNPDYRKTGKSTAFQEFIWNQKNISINDIAEVVNVLMTNGISLTSVQLNALTFSHGGWSKDRGKMESLATVLHCADILSLALGAKNKTEGVVFKSDNINRMRGEDERKETT